MDRATSNCFVNWLRELEYGKRIITVQSNLANLYRLRATPPRFPKNVTQFSKINWIVESVIRMRVQILLSYLLFLSSFMVFLVSGVTSTRLRLCTDFSSSRKCVALDAICFIKMQSAFVFSSPFFATCLPLQATLEMSPH